MSLWFRKYFTCVQRRKDKAQQPPKSKRKNMSSTRQCDVWRRQSTKVQKLSTFRSGPLSDGFEAQPRPALGHRRVVRARRDEGQGGRTGHAARTQPRVDPEQGDICRATAANSDSSNQLATSEYLQRSKELPCYVNSCAIAGDETSQIASVGGALCKRLMKFPRLKPLSLSTLLCEVMSCLHRCHRIRPSLLIFFRSVEAHAPQFLTHSDRDHRTSSGKIYFNVEEASPSFVNRFLLCFGDPVINPVLCSRYS